jgi:hypothetical protein
MDLDTLWNDRRDPHASPLASNPRRMYARAAGPSALGGMINLIYRPEVGDVPAQEKDRAASFDQEMGNISSSTSEKPR